MSLDELDGALLTGLAAACWAYYRSLIAEGFSISQAMVLVEAWQTSWLEAVREPDRTDRREDPA